MRGLAGERQVKKLPKTTLLRGFGGGQNLAAIILRTDEALRKDDQAAVVTDSPIKLEMAVKKYYEGLEAGQPGSTYKTVIFELDQEELAKKKAQQ